MAQSSLPSPSLTIITTLNQKGTGATLHINSQSDGRVGRWMEDAEESGEEQQRTWLVKLGVLLKQHGNIKCQWPYYQQEEPDTYLSPPSNTFNNPWAYRIANFPRGYKLFFVERPTQGDDLPRRDYYLCGIISFSLSSKHNITDCFFSGGAQRYRSPQEFFPHMLWMLNTTQQINGKCICKYCDKSRSQKEIDEIYPLPPHKGYPKGPAGPKKHKNTRRRQQGPRGVTIQRTLVQIRNSITTGPLATSGPSRPGQKNIGFGTSHPFRP